MRPVVTGHGLAWLRATDADARALPPLSDRATLPLAEVFGPTWQGEGPHTGVPARFVRLGHCNLSCGADGGTMRCDTPQTWDHDRFNVGAECPDTTTREIVERAAAIPAAITVLTGGEPLLHHRRPAFAALLAHLATLGPVHVETNGTIPPAPEHDYVIAHYSVSPKLTNTGDPHRRRIRRGALVDFNDRRSAIFKFVCANTADVDEVHDLVTDCGLDPDRVWIMPEGITADDVLATHRLIADDVLRLGYRTTTRLHTLLWGSERGR
jgi:organic radical activating enzyme